MTSRKKAKSTWQGIETEEKKKEEETRLKQAGNLLYKIERKMGKNEM